MGVWDCELNNGCLGLRNNGCLGLRSAKVVVGVITAVLIAAVLAWLRLKS